MGEQGRRLAAPTVGGLCRLVEGMTEAGSSPYHPLQVGKRGAEALRSLLRGGLSADQC